MPQAQNHSTIRFGVFEANLASAELRKNGQKIKLQEQPFQVLTILLENPGELVTREQFRATLWPADTFVDFDHGLNAAIKRLRDALGDSADSPRFVETLARRGYRFIAPVTVPSNGNGSNGSHAANAAAPLLTPSVLVPTPVAANPETNTVPAPPVHSNILVRHWILALSALVLLIAGSAAGWIAAHRLTQKPQSFEWRLTNNPSDDPILSVALSPDSKYAAFADRNGLFLRELSSGETHSIDVPGVIRPRAKVWFPDGSHLLVNAAQPSTGLASVYSVSLLGGSPRKLVDNAEARSISPDGSQIAVVRNDWPNQEIWLFSSDGQNSRQLVPATGDVFGAVVWSPHGRKLAFIRYKYGFSHHESENSIELYDLQTSQIRVVLSNPAIADSMVWSPDGRLIYSVQEHGQSPSIKSGDGDSNFWVLPIDENSGQASGAARRLTSGMERKMSPSLSADGKHLAFIRWNGEAHVYFSEVEPGARRIGAPQRLSLEEGRNYPYGWSADGKSIIFSSDRDGQFHLFQQRIDQPAPDLLVGGKDGTMIARPSPDGSQILYVVAAQGTNGQRQLRLMRVPLSGGAPQLVLQRDTVDNFQCARSPSTLCIFGQATAKESRFIQFDPITGQQTPLGFGVEGTKYNWSLSPDGQTIALAQWRQPEIHLVSTKTGKSRTLKLESDRGVSSLDWASDGQSLWASSSALTGTQALLNIDLRGNVRQLFQDPDRDIGWAIPSADGRHIAFWEAGGSSNAWVLKGF